MTNDYHVDADAERMSLLFKRSGALPVLSGSALSLIRAIDSGEAGAADLERIISTDPSLATNFLRVACSGEGDHRGPTTLRAAIMRLGQKTVRSIAVSLSIRDLLSASDCGTTFDATRFARHGLAVGLLAKYLMARKHRLEGLESTWSADELFAAGVLHDLSIPLLVKVMPEAFDRTMRYSERAGLTFNAGFKKLYGEHPTLLGATAAEFWGLPHIFVISLRHLHTPWLYQPEFTALCCLGYADYLANENGLGMNGWSTSVECEPEVSLEVGLPEEELNEVLPFVATQVDRYLESMFVSP